MLMNQQMKPVNLNTESHHLWPPYLKNNGLVVLLEVEGKDVSEHECGAALAEHVHSLL